jgi:hypothetical protein
MHYFVIAPDGSKYGPADIQTLNHWVVEGRVTSSTMLENATNGQQIVANSLPGMIFPVPSPGGAFASQSNYPRGAVAFGPDNGDGDLKTAWTFAIIGVCFALPMAACCTLLSVVNVFSILGIVYSSNAKKKGNMGTKGALACSIVGLALGPVVSIAIMLFFRWMK